MTIYTMKEVHHAAKKEIKEQQDRVEEMEEERNLPGQPLS